MSDLTPRSDDAINLGATAAMRRNLQTLRDKPKNGPKIWRDNTSDYKAASTMNKNSEQNTVVLGKGISYFDSTKGKRRSRENKNEQLIRQQNCTRA